MAEWKEKENELEAQLKTELNKVGNVVHETVIADDNEDNNAVVQTWGGSFRDSPRR